jgi:hypothetical protein
MLATHWPAAVAIRPESKQTALTSEASMDATGDFVPTVRHLPRQIGIELVRGCNFSCQKRPVTTNTPRETDHFQFIELGLLEKLVSEIDRWPSIGLIYFFHFGEPLAHPEFRQCLEILGRSEVASKAHVIQHTNGSLLRGEKADAILETNVVKRDTVARIPGHLDHAALAL